MNKFTLRFFSLFLCCIGIFFCTSCNDEQTSPSSPVMITELNTPYEGKHLKVTATEIKAVQNPTENHKIIVSVHFVVENISNENFSYYRGDIKAYVNNTSVIQYTDIESIPGKDLGFASLAPGKHTSGYFCLNIPEDTEVIELYFTEYTNIQTNAIFKFDVPATQSTESDTATTTSTFNNIDQNDITDLLTLDKYNQLEIGMTYNEVVEFIGSDGILSIEAGVKGTATYQAFYTWKGSDGAHAILHFSGENIELQTKTQFGLE